MSHTTTLRSVAIRDVGAMHAAVAALRTKGVNCTLVTNETPRMYYSNQGEKCDYVLRLHDGKYDVGFQKQEDDSLAPVFDEYMNNVGGQIGADVNVCPMPRSAEGRTQHQMGQFMQEYTKAAAIASAAAQGYSVENSTVDAEGNVHLTLGGI